MKAPSAMLIVSCLALFGCSDSTPTAPPADAGSIARQHEEITKRSILARFVRALSEDKYDQALGMLHPELAEAWTKERFALDWKSIKEQVPSGLQPKAMGSFAGRSAQGPFKQANYHLGPDWRSPVSLDMVSMQVGGKPRIVKIDVRMPGSSDIPDGVAARTDAFVAAMLAEEYDTVRNLFSASMKSQLTAAMLRRIRPYLADSPESTSRHHYRMCANSVWYDAVQLAKPDDPATYLELIITAGPDATEIASLSFKGRM